MFGETFTGRVLLLCATPLSPAVNRDAAGRATVTRRAERFGGRLEIDSAPGSGTRLRVRVPLA
jgi:signal transduction histidine kinase